MLAVAFKTACFKRPAGCSGADRPGGPEWRREREYLKEGIPLSRAAITSLENLSKQVGLPFPW
ncbi:MAG: hypothetical protein EXS64_19100 [Candidatus Latescibacteria bacterium]|nr:hypothetical protein [Candidatus Latescibacterota bacterium]